MLFLRRATTVLLTVATMSAGATAALGAQRTVGRVPAPCPPCPRDAICEACVRPSASVAIGAQRVSSHVTATLDGRVVRYVIDDRYVNRSGRVAEVDYLLPLPKGAAFENLELSINGEMVAGETMSASRARGIYEEIVRRLRDPALVEWMGHDLLRTRIFPIQPGEEKRVVVRFSAVVQREGDALRLDWPARTIVGARTNDDWFELRYPTGGRGGETLGSAYSPTHNLSETKRNNEVRSVRANDAGRTMTVLVPVRRAASATMALLPYAPRGEDGYALITLSPPAQATRGTPRDLTFIVDVSGSMSGPKIAQARAAGLQFLASLDRSDRFRIIAFSSDVRDFRDGWSPVTPRTIDAAREFINGLRANGGTNISGALDAALGASASRGRLPLVLLLTDGAPTVGETRPEVIARHTADIRGRARVFTFGLGADVNANLLEQLALEGRGTATFLRPNESVERAVGVVAERLTSPVATDVTIKLDDVRLYAIQPQGPIDLFAGQDLVVLARYAGTCDWTTLTIEGRGPDGPLRWTQRVRIPERSTQNAFVARLWAVQRVGWLSAERRRTGGNTELDDELRDLGERHGIPTELTSYLVVEPGMNIAQFSANAPSSVNQSSPTRPRDASVAGGSGAAGRVSDDLRRFEAAKLSSEQREVTTLGDERKDGVSEADRQLKVVGSRSFRADGEGFWTDTRTKTASRTVKIKAYSPAYFALIAQMPDLAPWLAVGDKVRVEGRSVTIEVSPDDGLTTLDAPSLRALVQDWR